MTTRTDAWLSQQFKIEAHQRMVKAPRLGRPTLDDADLEQLYSALEKTRGDMVRVKRESLHRLLADHAKLLGTLTNRGIEV